MMTQLVRALIETLLLTIYIYQSIIFIYIILTWIPEIQRTKFFEVLHKICNPFLRIFDRIIPPIGGISLSAIFALLTLKLLQSLLLQLF